MGTRTGTRMGTRMGTVTPTPMATPTATPTVFATRTLIRWLNLGTATATVLGSGLADRSALASGAGHDLRAATAMAGMLTTARHRQHRRATHTQSAQRWQ